MEWTEYERMLRCHLEGEVGLEARIRVEAERRRDPWGELVVRVSEPPSVRAWEQICRCAEQSPRRLFLRHGAKLCEQLDGVWPESLRVLPLRWWQAMAMGEARPEAMLACTLEVRGAVVSRAQVVRVVRTMSLRRLTRVELRGVALSDGALAALLCAPAMGGVEELDLKGNRVGDDGLSAIVDAGLEGLRGLHLGSNRLGIRGMRALGLSGLWEPLERLNLSWNGLGIEGVRALFSGEDTRLCRLSLEGVGMHNAGVEALVGRAWPRLEQLELGWNGIGDAGVEALASSTCFERLLRLDLRRNPVGVRGRAALRASVGLAGTERLRMSS